jgi:hypothetical protein
MRQPIWKTCTFTEALFKAEDGVRIMNNKCERPLVWKNARLYFDDGGMYDLYLSKMADLIWAYEVTPEVYEFTDRIIFRDGFNVFETYHGDKLTGKLFKITLERIDGK